ncbi:MAG: glutamate--cysteine ligase [Methylococcaceae bacterium]|nr:glutamate--cysteine ligase [Methylococcaceae bacterium]
MGQEIGISQFSDGDFARFQQKLQQETALLKRLINDKGCSKREPTAGFEIEAWLVDDNMRPMSINEDYIAHANNPLVSAELARFNIEFNSEPLPLTDNIFSQLQTQLQNTWNRGVEDAQHLNSQLLMIGTLPTLERSDLTLANISNMNRYHALNQQILAARGKPINLDITGNQHLKFTHDDVMLESAATSFQIHIQLPLDRAHHFYNASIIASAAMVAVCANTPFLFGKDLWHESRIPLFEQAIETGGYNAVAQGPLKRVSFGSGYANHSIFECFLENLQHFPSLLPVIEDTPIEAFEHLRLHNGTIWRWNRPLIGFDEDGTPHIRVEHRSPASGSTVVDTIANAAFYYGLSKNLSDEIMTDGLLMPFSQAKDNFYQAARYGLDSHIKWLKGDSHRLHSLFKKELLPRAKQGLISLGVSHDDVVIYLDIIQQRVETKQNGSLWQRQFMQTQETDFKTMTQHYLNKQQAGEPVGTWSLV